MAADRNGQYAAAAEAERRPLLPGGTAGEQSSREEYQAASDGGHRADQDDDEESIKLGAGAGTFTRSLGAVEAFAIVISIVIGSGVFTSPGSIDTNVPSPGAALLVWFVGGVLAWTGASTMAELGTAIPGEG
jgi:amino acid permease